MVVNEKSKNLSHSALTLEEHLMRILICDDEPLFAQRLAELLRSLADSAAIREAIDCVSDLTTLTDEALAQVDIAFLDIDMGEESVNGITLARRLRKLREDAVILFVTNFVEYSIEGYEVQAFRYLLKSELERKLPLYFQQAVDVCQKGRKMIRITCEGEEVDIPPNALVYIESLSRRSILHLHGYIRDTLTTRTTLNELTELLQARGFLRVHKSFLVNMAQIQKLQSTGLRLKDGTELPVSAHRYSEIKQGYLQWRGRNRWSIG